MSGEFSQLTGSWNYPTSIRFGPGRIREQPEACNDLGISKPLLITDPGLARLPMVSEELSIIEAAGLSASLFCEVRENPAGHNVEAGVAALKTGGHDGVLWTGCNATIYVREPRVSAQIDSCQRAFAQGIPQFGTCWGLQMAVVAAGGVVEANPRGRDMGIARRIVVTEEKRTHSMMEALHAEPYRRDLRSLLAIDDHVLDVTTRTNEFAKWVNEFYRC